LLDPLLVEAGAALVVRIAEGQEQLQLLLLGCSAA